MIMMQQRCLRACVFVLFEWFPAANALCMLCVRPCKQSLIPILTSYIDIGRTREMTNINSWLEHGSISKRQINIFIFIFNLENYTVRSRSFFPSSSASGTHFTQPKSTLNPEFGTRKNASVSNMMGSEKNMFSVNLEFHRLLAEISASERTDRFGAFG